MSTRNLFARPRPGKPPPAPAPDAVERLHSEAVAAGEAELARQARRARRNADRIRAEWRRARAHGDRTVARGARLLWSIFERAAREAERAAAGAAFEHARRSLADRVRADLGGAA